MNEWRGKRARECVRGVKWLRIKEWSGKGEVVAENERLADEREN